jgi:SpoIID/LytB domain protein
MKGAAAESATLDAVAGVDVMLRAMFISLPVALALTAGAAPGGPSADPPALAGKPTFFISGHGWGHGLGLSQYGAYGYAQHGWKYDRIVKHYYTGTTLGQAGASSLAFGSHHYRGTLQVDAESGRLRVINVVGLEQYLYGVVPSEMPHTWAPEALKAQAVAARSYALSRLHPGGGFDLFPDTRDQVYLGIPHEAPTTTAAVNATAGQVVLYKGKVASTYFFSTSGGRTASVQDLYPDSPPISYLVSVPDKYDSISPYHDWGPYRFRLRKLARGLKVQGRLLDVQTLAGSSGRVRSVVATGTRGQSTVTGAQVRAALGLRSTWFQVGVLALGAPSTPVTYGSATALTGRARGVGAVELQQRQPGGAWETVAKLSPRAGTVAPKVKPSASTSFRLAVGEIASSPVAVPVARSVRLHVPNDLSGFWGTVKPAEPGAVVRIQRQAGSGWRTLVTVKTTPRGRFTVSRAVAPGTYRARVLAGKGFVTSLSKPVAAAG